MVHEGVVARRQSQHKKPMWSRFLHTKQGPGWLSKSKLGKLMQSGCSIILPPSNRVMLKMCLFPFQHATFQTIFLEHVSCQSRSCVTWNVFGISEPNKTFNLPYSLHIFAEDRFYFGVSQSTFLTLFTWRKKKQPNKGSSSKKCSPQGGVKQ